MPSATVSPSAVTAMLFSNSDSIGNAHANETAVTSGRLANHRECPAASARHDRHRNLRLGDRQAQSLNLRRRGEPGPTFRNAMNVRIIRPDATRSTTARPTCTTTSACCALAWDYHRRSGLPRYAESSPRVGVATFTAGTRPNNKADATDTASVNASTRASMRSRTVEADSRPDRHSS